MAVSACSPKNKTAPTFAVVGAVEGGGGRKIFNNELKFL
jgi:hypothetical protein